MSKCGLQISVMSHWTENLSNSKTDVALIQNQTGSKLWSSRGKQLLIGLAYRYNSCHSVRSLLIQQGNITSKLVLTFVVVLSLCLYPHCWKLYFQEKGLKIYNLIRNRYWIKIKYRTTQNKKENKFFFQYTIF